MYSLTSAVCCLYLDCLRSIEIPLVPKKLGKIVKKRKITEKVWRKEQVCRGMSVIDKFWESTKILCGNWSVFIFVRYSLAWIHYALRTLKRSRRNRKRETYKEEGASSLWCLCAAGTRWTERIFVCREFEKRVWKQAYDAEICGDQFLRWDVHAWTARVWPRCKRPLCSIGCTLKKFH